MANEKVRVQGVYPTNCGHCSKKFDLIKAVAESKRLKTRIVYCPSCHKPTGKT